MLLLSGAVKEALHVSLGESIPFTDGAREERILAVLCPTLNELELFVMASAEALREWVNICTDSHSVVQNFAEHCQSSVFPTVLQSWPLQLSEHVAHAGVGPVITECKSGGTAQNGFKLVDVFLHVGVPDGT